MKIDEIRTIVQLMSKHDLTEFRIEAEEMRLCIKRGSGEAGAPVAVPQMVHAPMASPVAAQPVSAAPDAGVTEVKEPASRVTIDSPIVGTFYLAPSPDAEPFVKVGSTVSPDTVVCIVEAMKVMNEVTAGVSGIVREVLVENCDPVEFGQPLFKIETS